jgi:type IV pilus assembly protein PilN
MQARVPINLASEPFRRDRAMLVASTALALVLLAALVGQVVLVMQERERAAEGRAAAERLEAALARQIAERTKLEQELRQSQNAEVLDRNVFLNGLIARKAVSWTQLFADLEKVMPGAVRLVSVRPQITPANQVVLDMTVGSLSGEPVVDMLMRLEASPLFGATTITTMLPPGQNETLYRYRLSVHYAPQL